MLPLAVVPCAVGQLAAQSALPTATQVPAAELVLAFLNHNLYV